MTKCKSKTIVNGKTYRCCLKQTDTHKNGHVSNGRHWELTDEERAVFKEMKKVKSKKKSGSPSLREIFRQTMAQRKEDMKAERQG